MKTGETESLSALLNTGQSGTKSQASSASKLGQDDFLELMITQLENQNPLEPMENGEFLAQMAQFSTVSGIQDLQLAFNDLSASLQSNQALQASSLVGRTVLVEGDTASLAPGGTLNGMVELPASTSAVTLNVLDQSGQLVRTLELGPQEAGSVHFSWDGITNGGQPAPASSYRVSAEAILDGETTAVSTRIGATVESVSIGANGTGMVLNLAGIGPVELSQVQEIM